MTTCIESERQHPRHRFNTLCVVMPTDKRMLFADETLDVSWTGVRVHHLGGARLGERVRAQLKIPRSAVWVQAEGYVARVLHGRRTDDGPPALGIRLDRMDGMMRMLLAHSFRRRPLAHSNTRRQQRDYAEIVRRIGQS